MMNSQAAEAGPPVGAGDGHQHDLIERLQQPDAVNRRAAAMPKRWRARSMMAAMLFSVMPG